MEQKRNVHFDAFESRKMFEYYNKDPYYILIKIKNYIEKYPDDYSMLLDYVTILIRVNSIEEASTNFKIIKQKILNDRELDKYPMKKEELSKKTITIELKLLLYQGKYEEWLNIYKENSNYLDDKYLKIGSLYIRKQLGILNKTKTDKDRYLYRQLVDYSYDDFKEHIKHHMDLEKCVDDDMSTDEETKGNSFFNNEFPLDEIIDTLKEKIPNEMKMNGYYENEYIFRYDCNGRSFNKITDYFKVVTINNSNEFITMYPILYGEKLPYTDLNILKKDNQKVKKISQIEKFKKKYNM